ncbi:MAG: glycoside hydrolase family 127 protein, partial [Kiritimatiellae bacterium]|nr:glycoside hydrolase family 127 protein [Kiritimatiellia bacterium]
MKKISFWACVAVVATSAALPVQDAMKTPRLRDVRLQGVPAAKMNDLIRARLTSDFAKLNVFAEARRAFVDRDDDVKGHGGVWRGEFWGKQMLSAARVADYLADPAFTKFVQEECHRLMATQDPDGYLGSYKDKELVSIVDPEQTRKTYGWYPVWNIWNRKYAMWGMLMAYKTTGDKEILASVERQMKQLIGMLHRRNLKLHDTGTLTMHGLPSMSILKPLVMLYEETGDRTYLDFAAEMLPDWDRADGECPNFFRNATREPLHEWYPAPSDWAKTYEFLSCVDGLIEYYRATGDARCLETAKAIRDNLQRNELNVFGSVGFGDKIIGA